MATRPRPPALRLPRRSARRSRDAGRSLSVVTDAKSRENFTGTSPQRGLRALAVNRKYDDCHGGPSPTPQELTRAGHRRVDGRGTGPLGDFRPTGGPGGAEKDVMRPIFRRNLARSARIPSGKCASWPLPVSPDLRAQPPVTRLPRSLPLAGKSYDYESTLSLLILLFADTKPKSAFLLMFCVVNFQLSNF
ncbi:hypothetical protein ALC57_16249 [Trachymyrmex cornetzi]|uniref:Uncharacterized protein n=1 Tax=Trachymyrmex cornetzi TaxID=471704 RepID=A0A195DFJ1_9HYME|nr:hypothetical protein ALC57_16249 [Trachymyrmex cornetzi]